MAWTICALIIAIYKREITNIYSFRVLVFIFLLYVVSHCSIIQVNSMYWKISKQTSINYNISVCIVGVETMNSTINPQLYAHGKGRTAYQLIKLHCSFSTDSGKRIQMYKKSILYFLSFILHKTDTNGH